MTQIPAPAAGDEGVEPMVVVGRTIGGLALIIVGLVLAVGGAFGYFVVPFIAPFAGGIWNTLWDLDFVAAIVGGIGLVLLFIGGSLVQRARKRDLGMVIAPGNVAGTLREVGEAGDTPGETRAGNAPPTIL